MRYDAMNVQNHQNLAHDLGAKLLGQSEAI